MVMTRPPAFHIWKFLMKNMTSPNSGHKNVSVGVYSVIQLVLLGVNHFKFFAILK